jgi:hypothetical protein
LHLGNCTFQHSDTRYSSGNQIAGVSEMRYVSFCALTCRFAVSVDSSN